MDRYRRLAAGVACDLTHNGGLDGCRWAAIHGEATTGYVRPCPDGLCGNHRAPPGHESRHCLGNCEEHPLVTGDFAVMCILENAAGHSELWGRMTVDEDLEREEAETPEERAALLHRAADLIEAHREEIVPVLQAETGATARTVKTMQFFPASGRLRRYAKGALASNIVPLPPAVMPTTPLAPGGLISGAVHRAPVGVVTLAERHPEPEGSLDGWYETMVMDMGQAIASAPVDPALREIFVDGRAHMVGTSGAITSLAGIHLGLRRYQRNLVDGLWMTRSQCEAAADTLKRLGPAGRAAQSCIGPDRADLVLAGAAIMEAVQRAWPSARVRVADRGLREGLLLQQIRADRRPRRRRRRGRSSQVPAT
jgi:hypothetical protein